MRVRFLMLAAVLGTMALAGAAQAGIWLGGREYPDYMRSEIWSACNGLDVQSRRSAIDPVPIEENYTDPSSYHSVARLPFTLEECREAGIL